MRTAPNGGPTALATAARGPPAASSWKSTSIRRRNFRRRRTLPRCPRPGRYRSPRVPRGRPGWRIATWPWPRTRA